MSIYTDDIIKYCRGFQWDSGNSSKNWEKHNVTREECEEVFLNLPLFMFADEKHAIEEQRYLTLGITEEQRELSIIFTYRDNFIRIVSARDMSRKERRLYEEKTAEIKENTKILH